MINYYQPFLLPFLRFKSYRLPAGIRQAYFHSFEDALWVLLRSRNVPPGSRILLPDFWCEDVVGNIVRHGYVPVRYPVTGDFRTEDIAIGRLIRRHTPACVIVFHACGIPAMTPDKTETLVSENPGILFVEDCVHRLVDPERVRIFHHNHIVLDSLRKVSPFPGSFAYWKDGGSVLRPDPLRKEWGYVLVSALLYAVFRACFTAGMVTRSGSLVRFAHTRLLKRHDDLIGDSTGGYAGPPLFRNLHRHTDFERVRRVKTAQVKSYRRLLRPVMRNGWRLPDISEPDYGQLHVVPLVIEHGGNARLLARIENTLHALGIVCWFKFPDSPWCRNRAVLFLPVGFHIRPGHIRKIADALSEIPVSRLRRENSI